jgi:membrane protease YdiL (CAAX protease family)
MRWARTRWDAAPLVACGACYLALLGVRVAGAYSIPMMVLSIAAMPLVLLGAPTGSWRRTGTRPGRPWRVCCVAVGVVVAAYAVTMVGSFTAFGRADANWLTGLPRLFQELVPGSAALRLAAVLACLGVAVPVVEEVCYRGVFFHTVAERAGPWGAVLVTSALWSVAHLGDYGLNPYRPAVVAGSQVSVFLMGLGLGVCRRATGSVAVCVIAQGTANLGLYGSVVAALH